MKFIIHSPTGIETEQSQVDAVRAILADGKPLTILPRHAPLIAAIGQKPIIAVRGRDERSYRVKGGILLVADDTVKVLANGLQESEPANE